LAEDNESRTGVYDILKAEPKASRLRACVALAFFNNDNAAGVREPECSDLTFALLFTALDEEANFDRRAITVSAFRAARSRSLIDDMQKDVDDGIDTVVRGQAISFCSSLADKTTGVPIVPQVVIGD